jgi:hypothetical protein
MPHSSIPWRLRSSCFRLIRLITPGTRAAPVLRDWLRANLSPDAPPDLLVGVLGQWHAEQMARLGEALKARVVDAVVKGFPYRQMNPQLHRPAAQFAAGRSENDARDALCAYIVQPFGDGQPALIDVMMNNLAEKARRLRVFFRGEDELVGWLRQSAVEGDRLLVRALRDLLDPAPAPGALDADTMEPPARFCVHTRGEMEQHAAPVAPSFLGLSRDDCARDLARDLCGLVALAAQPRAEVWISLQRYILFDVRGGELRARKVAKLIADPKLRAELVAQRDDRLRGVPNDAHALHELLLDEITPSRLKRLDQFALWLALDTEPGMQDPGQPVYSKLQRAYNKWDDSDTVVARMLKVGKK